MAPAGGSSRAIKAFSSTVESVSSLIFIIFAALFLAAAPHLYVRMLITLFPPTWRDDARQALRRMIRTLKYWLLGQLIAMCVVGAITGVALALVGIPFALELGILAGLGEFIPFIGPILVSIPALLLALSEGTNTFLMVLAIVLGVQFLEGNVIMPIVQRRAIQMPPVVTLSSMLILGGSFGLLGLFVAAPLVAIVLVLIEELYLKRFLRTTDKLLE